MNELSVGVEELNAPEVEEYAEELILIISFRMGADTAI
jgi:hypothetical protein